MTFIGLRFLPYDSTSFLYCKSINYFLKIATLVQNYKQGMVHFNLNYSEIQHYGVNCLLTFMSVMMMFLTHIY